MTEEEWMTSNDPQRMLEQILADNTHPRSGTLALNSARKIRLFAVDVCRQLWDGSPCPNCNGENIWAEPEQQMRHCLYCHGRGKVGGLTDPRSRAAVEVAERFADGEATEGELFAAESESIRAATGRSGEWVLPLLVVSNHVNALRLAPAATSAGVPQATQADLLRCVFGNPWRPKPLMAYFEGKFPGNSPCGPSPEMTRILSWNGGIIPRLSQHVYDERSWGDLPILCDALEEASCDDVDMLNHLRGAGSHARGCWCLDILLGKS